MVNLEKEIETKINKIIPLSKTNLYYKNKLILSANTLGNLEKEIKTSINNPKKDKHVYVIRVKYDPEDTENFLSISCSKKIITQDLELVNVVGTMKNIIYTSNDYEKIGFKKNILNKIIKVVDNKLLTKNITSGINDVIKISKV